MAFFQRMFEKIDAVDHFTINRIRVVAALVAALVFGVVLRGYMFSHETFAVGPVSAQPAFVYQAPARIEETAVQAESVKQEGDGTLFIEESVTSESVNNDAVSVLVEEKTEEVAVRIISSGEAITLSARAYVVASGASGRDAVYEKNMHTQLPPASLTKLMTAVIVTEYVAPHDVITITPRAVNAEGVAGSLRVGETFSVPDLLEIMLVVSSNDAATAFEDHFASLGFDLIALMNEKARLLGMVDTHFANPTGLDDPEHYSSASDIAVLATYSLRHEQLWDILSETSSTVRSLNKKAAHAFLSNNELLHKKLSAVLGGKTGYTKNAGGCMITALTTGEVIVVLGSDDRAGDTEKLIAQLQQLQ